ncbi:hypothetical protein [Dyadobacter sp.]|uniref:hypothetical protein n=1 Tax=Dyadobacter sp. TaxID=1914288 RepID=UPI003F72CD4F
MKSFLKTIILFFAFAVVTYLCFLCIAGTFLSPRVTKNLFYQLGGYTNKRLKEVKNANEVDVLFLGSSHAEHGYDVRIFQKNGLSSFNLGSHAQTPIQSELLLNRYLDQLSPKIVILDIYPRILDSDGVESALDLISNETIRWDLIKQSVAINNMKVYNTLLYAMLRHLLNANQFNGDPTAHKEGVTYITGGYVETLNSYADSKKFVNSALSFPESQLIALNRMTEVLKRKNIRYIIFQAPVTSKNYTAVSNNKEIDSTLSALGNYYNANEHNSWPNKLFYDDSHLNQDGVDIFNKEIIRLLSDNGLNFRYKSK